MTTHTRTILVAAFVALSLPLIACKKEEAPPPVPTEVPAPPTAVPTPAPAVTITDVSLGTSVGADKKVQKPTDTFKPKDTIFAAVSTDGSAASSTIGVKWTFGDNQTVKEDSKTIAPTGPATTEFSIQKPSGWPKGSYKVETSVDGKPGPSKTFTVK
jgi:hypothetical protein